MRIKDLYWARMGNSKSKPKSNLEMQNQGAQSALVVAHADDEILFFSSIIKKVDIVIVCFMGNPRVPQRGIARMRVLNEYPIENILTLDIDTSGATRFVNWDKPVESYAGLEIQNSTAREAYRETYEDILDKLRHKLSGYKTVYTHNPWGEYGHADHVQVHRAVELLAGELGFRVLFSNYVSPRSIHLALPYISKTGYLESVSNSTDLNLAHQVRELYIKENCWTVPDNFSWPKFESFNSKNRDNDAENSLLFVLNFIPWRYQVTGSKSLLQRLLKNLTRIKITALGALKSISTGPL
jgi:LmbE family N-acetylglucosaminyl deacetylase